MTWRSMWRCCGCLIESFDCWRMGAAVTTEARKHREGTEAEANGERERRAGVRVGDEKRLNAEVTEHAEVTARHLAFVIGHLGRRKEAGMGSREWWKSLSLCRGYGAMRALGRTGYEQGVDGWGDGATIGLNPLCRCGEAPDDGASKGPTS